jgi:hypothetical protein
MMGQGLDGLELSLPTLDEQVVSVGRRPSILPATAAVAACASADRLHVVGQFSVSDG